MKYREITIHTTPQGVEAVSNVLIALGVGGFEVVDSRDFEEFLESTTPHWDYVDDELLKLRDAESVIRIYLPDNDQGLVSFGMIRDGMQELRDSEMAELYGTLEITLEERDDSQWTDTWKQYYKPIVISDKLPCRSKKFCGWIPARPLAPAVMKPLPCVWVFCPKWNCKGNRFWTWVAAVVFWELPPCFWAPSGTWAWISMS